MKYNLCDVCDFQGGSQPPKEEWSSDLKDGFVRMLQIRDFTQTERVKPEYIKVNNSTKMCDNSDILIARYGASIGKIVTGLSGAYNVALMKVIPNDRILNKKYLYYYLKSSYFQNSILNAGSRAAQAGFNKDDLAKLSIKCPSLEEQVEREERLNLLQKVIKLKKEQLKLLDDLIKSRFVALFGNPAINEKRWQIRDLENVTTVVTYGLTVRPEYITEGIDLVSAKELHKGFVDYNAAPKISENDFAKLSEKGKPQKNDILFSKTGSIGHCALVTEEKPFAITQNAARIGLKTETVNPLWLLYYLRMDYIQDWCKDHAKGNAVKDFQLQDMKVIPLFDCPLELQNQFAAFVEQIDKSKFVSNVKICANESY